MPPLLVVQRMLVEKVQLQRVLVVAVVTVDLLLWPRCLVELSAVL
jgi:hypothetical protein